MTWSSWLDQRASDDEVRVPGAEIRFWRRTLAFATDDSSADSGAR
jgi:hypothetical protein